MVTSTPASPGTQNPRPGLRASLACARADMARFCAMNKRGVLYNLLAVPGTWACLEYRYSNWVYRCVSFPLVRIPLKAIGFLWHKWIEATWGIDIAPQAEIGPGLYIGHFGGIFVAPQAILGARCMLSQGVTLGTGGRGIRFGAPRLGNDVYFAPGAKAFGRIRLGNGVAVGANSVVSKSFPDGAILVGVPAQVSLIIPLSAGSADLASPE